MLETPSRENSTTLTPFSADELLELGREVVRIEADAVLALVDRLGPAFVDAVRLMLEHKRWGQTQTMGRVENRLSPALPHQTVHAIRQRIKGARLD